VCLQEINSSFGFGPKFRLDHTGLRLQIKPNLIDALVKVLTLKTKGLMRQR
jgi:hypothetical protein